MNNTERPLKTFGRLSIISLLAGTILLFVLKAAYLVTGNTAYVLLFNFDYIPILKHLQTLPTAGYAFHFFTCFASVVALFYLLKKFNLHQSTWIYISVYTIGGGILFFLTALSPQPPAANDLAAWIFWTTAHAIYGIVVALLIRHWVNRLAVTLGAPPSLFPR